MKQFLALVATAAVAVTAVLVLKSHAEFEGGHGQAGSSTAVTFQVRVGGDYHHDADDAAGQLWQACTSYISWESVSQPEVVSAGVYRATVSPSLSEDPVKKLRGCLEDTLLNGVKGHVRSTVG